MADGHREEIGPLADLGSALMFVATKATNAQIALAVAQGEYVEVATETGRRVKCAPRTKLSLAAGGFTYAEESNGATVETETRPEKVTGPVRNGKSEDLVSVRLTAVHAIMANGFWFLVD
jgi:hypothetical protein